MQLFVREVVNMAYLLITVFTQMVPIDDAEKSPVSHTALTRSRQYLHNKKRRPNREHRCDAGQRPSKGQVRKLLTTL